jgi:hypothetical protein
VVVFYPEEVGVEGVEGVREAVQHQKLLVLVLVLVLVLLAQRTAG